MNDEWYYLNGSVSIGPITLASIRTKVDQGAMASDTLVWREGMKSWSPVGSVYEINHVSTPPPPPGYAEPVGAAGGLAVPRPLRVVGSSIMLAEGYQLPDSYCVCCGRQSHRKYSRNFGHTPPVVWVALIAPIVWIILFACLHKERRLRFGLCEQHARRILIMNLVCWISGSMFIPLLILGASHEIPFLVVFGLLVFINWIVFCHLARPLAIEGLENGYIKIRGVCRAMRESLKGQLR
jgi:hypothetical protein